jgi:hypothetical protein
MRMRRYLSDARNIYQGGSKLPLPRPGSCISRSPPYTGDAIRAIIRSSVAGRSRRSKVEFLIFNQLQILSLG